MSQQSQIFDPGGAPALQEFPLYYSGTAPFQNNGQPSGLAGAFAQVRIALTNAPHIIGGIRIVLTYPGEPSDLVTYRQGYLDDENTVEISLAQQNITAGPVHQRTICGTNGILWQPFYVPFGAAGTNNFNIRLVRVTSFPAVVQPTAWVTLFCSQLNASMFAGTPAPGPVPRRG